ncbi:hypothetical protein SM0020_19001 [Sinorhizobium meliloti CCNWSX0020]|jgi:hypothetical protein|uniref:Uncharacterized protein n=1 Tax=Sinorhizobium meliloti CCNWSX0020 TaxID=1107881 RepID=H0G2V7_RHIML|nr:hypothetical protein SM0020_19001 [Sinorhizobium meliloti CCNWSX0020]
MPMIVKPTLICAIGDASAVAKDIDKAEPRKFSP